MTKNVKAPTIFARNMTEFYIYFIITKKKIVKNKNQLILLKMNNKINVKALEWNKDC